MMGKTTSPTGDQSLSWGNANSLHFGGKKQSMPVNSQNDVNYQGMTSKYSFNVDAEGSCQEPGSSNLASKKNTKTLKFKDDSPTLTQSRNNSGDLMNQKKTTALKANLNDSSSKQLGFSKRRTSANETGNFGKGKVSESEAKLRSNLPIGTSSTLPDIKNFYQP